MSLYRCHLMFHSASKGSNKRIIGRVLLLLLGLSWWMQPVFAQNRKDLEDKRRKLIEEIDQTNTRLSATRKDKNAALQVFLTLQSQVKKREQLINNLHQEITFNEESILRTNDVLVALQDDVSRLKQEYTQTLRLALRNKLNQSYLVFLLSADNLNTAIRRWQYIRQYQRYRKRQAKMIAETQKTLQAKTIQLERRIREKEKLLGGVEQQKQNLSVELQDKDKALKSLKADERVLLKELTNRQKSHNQLNRVIENVIQQEMLAQRKKARSAEALANANNPAPVTVLPSTKTDRNTSKASVNTPSPTNTPPAEDVLATGSFGARRGRLGWPVDQGRIVQGFGTFQHPKYKDVKVSNSGLDIGTVAAGKVRAVFEGKVVGAQFINGYQYTVILQHGTYYTVYSNLASVSIKRGDSVTSGQEIGQVGTEKPEMHFELWRDKQKLNPTSWLERK
jgi:septal ring factor EnvC (AmiA/AmiB activator)